MSKLVSIINDIIKNGDCYKILFSLFKVNVSFNVNVYVHPKSYQQLIYLDWHYSKSGAEAGGITRTIHQADVSGSYLYT